ncbi:MAG: transcriptional regulator [Desulfobacteraceae bacterium]
MKTLRQQMITILQSSPMDKRDLSQALRISEKEVNDHLPHVAKTATAQGMTWQVTPAYCDGCRFTFKDRKRIAAPSKCPKCKASRIQGPWFQVIPPPAVDRPKILI